MPKPFDLTLYLVTDPRLVATRGLLATVDAAVRGGATIVQLRDPDAHGRALVEQARALKALLAPLGIPLIINDRVDVAVAADADGVHLGQDDMTPADARTVLGPSRILGLSVGNPAEYAASDLGSVDYLGVGPVKATGTKADAGGAIGAAGVAAIRALTRLPIVGIGGLGTADVADVIRAGADGVAVVSAICAASDPEQAARALKAAVAAAR
ncbi:thiamine phosphate synthase [Xanthobacter oligotrophicus]|uniref:thiamine phosphate synthase n=1 Tax=Xanthobacter oligotrophicus TaxID=2607286 RepID=UPI0011F1445C|nr:thiamine phosphate synthase [Xanthobacter oligotrophicus]MCG5237624.1 thiamine phosphate synthase [Xanthobacter oligotrophicus]